MNQPMVGNLIIVLATIPATKGDLNMPTVRTIVVVVLVLIGCLASRVSAEDTPKSYPVTLEANDVHEIAKLSIESNGLTINGTDVVVVPIRCEPGVTGAMVLGKGEFKFAPDNGDEIKGVFRAVMLRFSPTDQPKLLPLDDTKPTTDQAALAISIHLLNNVFRHCWHRGNQALIPDDGSFVANVYSTTHGDLLISTGSKATVVHSFTENKTLYPKK